MKAPPTRLELERGPLAGGQTPSHEAKQAVERPQASMDVAELRCPISPSTVGLDALSLDLCNRLELSDCPLATPVHERLSFETLLAELSATFVNVSAENVDAQIESALKRLVEFLGVDRGGFAEILPDDQLAITHSHQKAGIPAPPRFILNEQWPWYTDTIRKGEVLRIESIPSGLPVQAAAERAYCTEVGLKSHIMIPLKVMNAVVGAIGFAAFRESRVWPDDLIRRLRLIGEIFTNAVARKRADQALRARERSLRRARKDLRTLAARLLHAQEKERRRIAREMHDDWTQRLAILCIDVERLARRQDAPEKSQSLLQTMQSHLVKLSEDVHALSRQLHPSIIDDLGLVEALRSECASFSQREGIWVEYAADSMPNSISKDIALCVYRVAQEALRNVAKHAGTKSARLTLRDEGGELALTIADRGVGFVQTKARSKPGLGFSSMQERVRLVRGRIVVAAAPGEGTSIEIRIPWPRSRD